MVASDKSQPLRILLLDMELEEYTRIKKLLANSPLQTTHLTLSKKKERYLEDNAKPKHSLIILSTRVGKNELIETVKELILHSSHIPILVLGNQNDSDSLIRQLLELGVQDFLNFESLTINELMRASSFAFARNSVQQSLREQTMTDMLTGLANRRGFENFGTKLLSYAKRHQQKVTLMLIDLNFFKEINDLWGHPTGDEALIQMACCMKRSVRAHDLTARLSGDEFALMLMHQNGNPSQSVFQHLQQEIERFNRKNPKAYKLSISTGLCTFDPENPLSLAEMVKIADERLYMDKKEHHMLMKRVRNPLKP